MSTLEAFPRRTGFSEGRWFQGPDGKRLCLPVLGEAEWDAYPRIREWFDPERMLAQTPGAWVLPLSQDDLVTLTIELLLANYEVGILDLVPHVAGEDGDIREQACGALMGSLEDASPVLVPIALADQMGVDRRDSLALSRIDGDLDLLKGWYDHAGLIFQN